MSKPERVSLAIRSSLFSQPRRLKCNDSERLASGHLGVEWIFRYFTDTYVSRLCGRKVTIARDNVLFRHV
jgi:hypothetical protein